ncbi:hypothetical protein [Pendulispora albinea]|uniref:Uncharacterized protein n=1 Tax=Pendulispora albinea TaxID=2741071 RepID=A0ABZ2LY33_9BACT
MGSSDRIDFGAAFEDAVAIAKSARSATLGWRAICVRERRKVGSKLIEPLSELDLDEDLASIARTVRGLARGAARDVDTFVFGLFDAIDDGSGAYAGYHVAAVASHGRDAGDFMLDPWTPERHFLRSRALDAIVLAASRAPRDIRPLLEYSLCFGAAALTSRFAMAGLPHRLVVAFDDDHGRPPPEGAPRFAEIVPTDPHATRRNDVSDAEAVVRLLTRV